VAQFDTLHSRTADGRAVACAFDLLMRDGDDLRRQPFIERKAHPPIADVDLQPIAVVL